MKLIAGLGNPGSKYKNNRHNVGYMVIDVFAKSRGFSWRYSQDLICYFVKANNFVIVKPTTYVNKSGESIGQVANFYKVQGKDILVVHDDLDLDFGRIHLSFGGSSAGHKGVESIIESLGYQDFCRLRVGIGRPTSGGHTIRRVKKSAERYVLEDFPSGQGENLKEVIKRCDEASQSFLDDGIQATMNKFN